MILSTLEVVLLFFLRLVYSLALILKSEFWNNSFFNQEQKLSPFKSDPVLVKTLSDEMSCKCMTGRVKVLVKDIRYKLEFGVFSRTHTCPILFLVIQSDY